MALLTKLKELLARSRFRSFDRSDQLPPDRRTVENDDAWTQGYSGDQFPPNYVRPADEGRPRH